MRAVERNNDLGRRHDSEQILCTVHGGNVKTRAQSGNLYELLDIVPANPSLPVQPIIALGQNEPKQLAELRSSRANYMQPVPYASLEELLGELPAAIVEPAEA